MRKLFISLVCVGLLLAVYLWFWYHEQIETELMFEPDYTLNIRSGDSLTTVANQLQRDGVLQHSRVMSLYARSLGLENQIKAGEYRLQSGMTVQDVLEVIVEGKVILHQVTIPEGYTFQDMLVLLHQNPYITPSLKGKTPAEIMQLLGKENEHPEGRFLPETYSFAKGTDDIKILKNAYVAMQEILHKAWGQRSADSVLSSPYEALILASIIEKETGVFDEQATIAGVFNSRLKKGMRLQTDPTVIYGMGESYQGNIRKKDLRTDTPYNTYTRFGLPPTPIALPGENAIHAALSPEQHDKLYFVATGQGDGRHYFSATLEEHNRAVERYLQRYRQNNP